jgi:hypothetical protein
LQQDLQRVHFKARYNKTTLALFPLDSLLVAFSSHLSGNSTPGVDTVVIVLQQDQFDVASFTDPAVLHFNTAIGANIEFQLVLYFSGLYCRVAPDFLFCSENTCFDNSSTAQH